MAVKFMRNGQQVLADFYHGTGDNEVLVPFGNLVLWDAETLAQYGVTREVTPDVPAVISDRQFFQLLAMQAVITQEEALAAVGPGVIPAAMEAFIDQLPMEQERFAARMLLSGATQFERNHPLVGVFASLFGWSSNDLDQFWIGAAQL